jgi:hypothetical protein
MVFQVPDQSRPEFADIGFNFPDILSEAVQLGDHDLVTVGSSIPVPAGDQGPGHDHHQDSDGADYLGQPSQVLH